MWYENNVFVATISLTLMGCLVLFRVPEQAKDILIQIITAIAAFVTGYSVRSIKDSVTTRSTTTKEEESNVPLEEPAVEVKK
jgi:hypothetical protein